jgi:DNA polymerase Ligase (LigD)
MKKLFSRELPKNCEMLPMPRFVILHHTFPKDSERNSHWDLMLETDHGLRTWACNALPLPDTSVLATALVDHRAEYLTYEGAVSQNRGHVTRVLAGEFLVIHETSHELQIRLTTASYTYELSLQQLTPNNDWHFVASKAITDIG